MSVGIASDLIEFDKKYEQIMLSLLGRTVVVEDMDTAIKVAKENRYSFRIVTLLGDVINPSGQMTGGSSNNRSNSILGRSRHIEELKVKIVNLQEVIKNKTKEFEEYRNAYDSALLEIKNLETELKEVEIVLSTENQKINNIQENILRQEVKKEALNKENLDLKNNIENLKNNIDEYNSLIYELVAKIAKAR